MGVKVSGEVGKGSMNHNNREHYTENVDPSRTPENITFCREDIQDVYHQLFDEALEKYNAKKTKTRDKIHDYYDHIYRSKQEKPFHEAVFQIGNMDNCACGTPQGYRAAAVLQEFMDTFQRRNPHLRVFNAVLHMDESTPHIHVDFIPIATEQKRGLETRVSLKRALLQQGFKGTSKKQSEWKAWMNSEKAVLEKMATEHDFVVEHGEGGRKHLSLPEFKAAAHELDEAKAELDTIRQQLHEQQELRESQEQELKQLAEEKRRLEEERAALIEETEQISLNIMRQTEKDCEEVLSRFTTQLERLSPPTVTISKHELHEIKPEKGLMGLIKGISLQTIQNMVQALLSMLSWADDVQQELKTAKQLLPKKESLRQRLDAANKSLLQRTPMEKSKQHDTKKRNTPSL